MNTPGMGICDPIAGLTDCQTDSDCVVVDAIGCCPCEMGGFQGAIRNDKQSELSGQLAGCCQDLICLAVFLCQDVEARCQGGTCTLVTASAIPTPIATVPATPTAVTPMSVVSACYGDCDGDGRVTVDEIMMLINMALGGSAPAEACPAASVDCNPSPFGVYIDCLLEAIDHAVHGCP